MFSWKGCRERREGIRELGIPTTYLSSWAAGRSHGQS